MALRPSAAAKSKASSVLTSGKRALAEALPDDRLVPRVQLGAQHFLQVVFVRPVRIARLTGQALEGPGDARQFQGARVRDDEIAGQRGVAHAGTSVSQPS